MNFFSLVHEYLLGILGVHSFNFPLREYFFVLRSPTVNVILEILGFFLEWICTNAHGGRSWSRRSYKTAGRIWSITAGGISGELNCDKRRIETHQWHNGLTDRRPMTSPLNWPIISITSVYDQQLTWYNSLWHWGWLPHKLSKCQSLLTTTVLFRTTFTRTIMLSLLMLCRLYCEF